ncbi:MAG TPA: class I SAM-dependent methyltransferase [Chitinophagaceae bacterium]|jgi:SAM-dependent methyltransferase|nr:class I SAM-dependent methyltransferase [Chitinophagaceae bacterium]
MSPDHPLVAECPVCRKAGSSLWARAKDEEYFSSGKTYDYFHCPDCDTIFIDPVPLTELKTIYPSNYYSFKAPKGIVVKLKEWLDKRLFKKILASIPGDSINILDIGGGSGWLLNVIKKLDQRVNITQVVDIDPDAGKIALSNGHRYFEGVLEDFTSTEKFHLVLMLNLLEHVANPQQVLQKTDQLLHPDGVILIKTPNTRSWDARLFRRSYWGGLHCPRHWVIFSEKSFRLLLPATKLSVQKLRYTQGAPFWAFSIIAALHRKRLVRVSAQRPIVYHWLFAPISALFAIFDFTRRAFTKTSQMFVILKKTN